MAVRRAREIVAASPLADVIEEELQPGAKVQSDEEILDFIRKSGGTTYHPVGTCKMGQDPHGRRRPAACACTASTACASPTAPSCP